MLSCQPNLSTLLTPAIPSTFTPHLVNTRFQRYRAGTDVPLRQQARLIGVRGHKVAPLRAHLEHPQTPNLLQIVRQVDTVVVRAKACFDADLFWTLLYYVLQVSLVEIE
jgi:hypothetical protein